MVGEIRFSNYVEMSEDLLLRRHCQAGNSRYEQQPPERIGCQLWTVCWEARLDGWCGWSEKLIGSVYVGNARYEGTLLWNIHWKFSKNVSFHYDTSTL